MKAAPGSAHERVFTAGEAVAEGLDDLLTATKAVRSSCLPDPYWFICLYLQQALFGTKTFS